MNTGVRRTALFGLAAWLVACSSKERPFDDPLANNSPLTPSDVADAAAGSGGGGGSDSSPIDGDTDTDASAASTGNDAVEQPLPMGPPPAAPALSVEPEALDLGAVTLGFAARGRIDVVNAGTSALAVPQVVWLPEGDPDFELIQNQCLSELEAGARCELRVQALPSRVGALRATLAISSPARAGESAASLQIQVPISAQGLSPGELVLAAAEGSSSDFGGVLVGGRAEATLRVTHPGPSPSGALSFQLSRSEFELLEPAAGQCTAGVTELGSGESCELRVAFSPVVRGPLEATLTVTADSAGSSSLRLLGDGRLEGLLGASSARVDFGGVVLGESALATVQLHNRGDEPLQLGGVRLAPEEAGEFSIQTSNCGEATQLWGGASCSVELEFRPTQSAEPRSAELVAEVVGGEALSVPLSGQGLEPGSLVVSAESGGLADFGSVLLGEQTTLRFEVENPGSQPSGVLTLAGSEGFLALSPSAAGDCEPDVTSLVNGESCRVSVRFEPSLRQSYEGFLTVSSALAGAVSLPLLGRGITAARLEVESELDFGRVLTDSSGERELTIGNGGDQPLQPPRIEISGSTSQQGAAFSVDTDCVEALALGDECRVTLTFAPSEPVPHSADLRLSSDPGGTASVLLLGEALAPGSLVLAVAGGAGSDYGDVAVGDQATRTFTLTNPGNVASGPLTLRTDDNRFAAGGGDCAATEPEGLVDGASCSFQVSFTPDRALQEVANLSVESPGAGSAGLELRGRGRNPAQLSATGNRDFGRANIGQASLTEPRNEFVWTVNNVGDLPTGLLQVQRQAGSEFQVSGDTCNQAQLPGRASCQMTLRFFPDDPAGPRDETLVVTDTESGGSVTLTLTGEAVRLAGPGESCINATCESGVCTRGVCCNRECEGTCQVCNQGLCTEQSNQESCGAGEARCFGVDQCLLPEGQACGATADCGGNLQCTACTFGGSQCTPPGECCGACPGSTSCQNGTCGCGFGQVDCGGDRCIENQAEACCDNSDCPGECRACGAGSQCQNVPERTACSGGRLCTAAGDCVACIDDGDCGATEECDLSSGACVALDPAQMVTVTAPSDFELFTVVRTIAQAQSIWTLRNGGELATAPLQIASSSAEFLVGGNCLGASIPPGGSCAATLSFAPTEPGARTTTLTLTGGGEPIAVTLSGNALAANGDDCPQDPSLCESGLCTEWLVDVDGDGVGAFGEALGGVPSRYVCGDDSLPNRPPDFIVPGGCRGNDLAFEFVPRSAGLNNRLDCCEFNYGCGGGLATGTVSSAQAFPGQTVPFASVVGSTVLGGICDNPRDFNCDGEVTLEGTIPERSPFELSNLFGAGSCSGANTAAACSNRGGRFSGEFSELACGSPRVLQACAFNSTTNTCSQVSASPIAVTCL